MNRSAASTFPSAHRFSARFNAQDVEELGAAQAATASPTHTSCFALIVLPLLRWSVAVLRYMLKCPPRAGFRQRWATFLQNHLHETLAIDFAVVPTATFGILYAFFVLSLERRQVLHFNVTQHPTAEWTAQQLVEAGAFDLPGRFLIRDNDKIYGMKFRRRVDGLGLMQIRTAFRSPWQNGFAERWIASLRRDCLDHVIPIKERQLRRVIRSYVDYYHADRTHLGLGKDAPEERPIEFREMGEVVAFPRVGGLHHRYTRELLRAA